MKRLIIIAGPTAIGKTALSIALAKELQTEILSCDSRQFYREMPIGTAAPTTAELHSVKHHFIGHLSIHDEYNAGLYEKDAILLLNELFKKYENIILTGGSGLYMDAVVHGLDDFPGVPDRIKEKVAKDLAEKGLSGLQQELREKDPESYSVLDLQNPRRLTRAIEVIRSSGKPFSYFKNSKKKKREFELVFFAMQAPRDILYKRIDRRVEVMMQAGLVAEARKLYQYRHLKPLQTVGYKELFKYFDGEWTEDFAVSEIKKNTRRYAKRQLTWLRKKNPVPLDYQCTVRDVLQLL